MYTLERLWERRNMNSWTKRETKWRRGRAQRAGGGEGERKAKEGRGGIAKTSILEISR